MSSSSIKVAVRCRPLLGQERPAGGLDIQNRRILLDSKTYDPDFTFPPTSSQEDVFQACRPILQCVKEGMNGTIMVYGQTGTGKTFTMLGNGAGEHGLVHKVVAHMLDHVQVKTADGAQCALTLSMIEIYNERLTDMLSPNGEEEVTLIAGFPRFAHKATLCRVHDAVETIQRGLAWRHTAATLMNERSSRSHVVFIFDMEEYNAYTEQTEVAHLFMIDLAGSESLKKSQASGVAAGEAGKINKSLLALKSVLLALSNTNEATRPSHVPYRDSKLTELLQDSIGGTARTLMIACISSVGRDIEETKSTLLYAVKARSIRNAANTEKEKLLVRLRSMEVENQKLRNRLQERVNERGGYYVTKEEHEQTQEMAESYEQVKAAVKQLMQDRQSSDARQHIWVSQVKVLHALLEDKEAALQGFKEVYHEALKRFEYQASTLQRMVRGGVADAKDAVQSSFADHYARLHAWRTELQSALEEPVPTSLSAALTAAAAAPDACPTAPADAPDGDEEQHPRTASRVAEDTASASVAAALERRSCTPPPPSQQPSTARSVAGPGAPSHSSPPRTAATPALAAGKHTAALPHSARGSTASSLQRGSVASGLPSASVSPTRRPGRPRTGTGMNGPRRCALGNAASSTLRGNGLPPLSSPSLCPAQPSPGAGAEWSALMQDGNEEDGSCGGAVPRSTGGAPPAYTDASAPLPIARATTAAAVTPSCAVSTPAWSSVLAQYDAQCLRAVQRVNEAVAAMLQECLQSFTEYREHAERAEQQRRHGVVEVCQRLRSELEANLSQLQRIDGVAERDAQEAREVLGDRLRLHTRLPSLADAAPFQVAVREACGEVVRHAAQAFPYPCTPAHAEAALDVIVRNVQRSSASFTLHSLDPLSSSAVGGGGGGSGGGVATSSSSAASSPVMGRAANTWGVPAGSRGSSAQLVDLVPSMPPLSAPTACESPREAPLCSSAESPSTDDLHDGVSAGDGSELSPLLSQGWRGTAVPSPSQGTRASALRRSVALSTLTVNRSRGATGGSGKPQAAFKRTRSTAASSCSSAGDAPPPPPAARRATANRKSTL